MSRDLPPVPLVRPTLPPLDELRADLEQIWRSDQLSSGRYGDRLERAVEARLEVPHAVAVSSCTVGIMLAVRALGLSGEVVLPSFTWSATGLALLWNGVTPVFADVVPGSFTLSPQAVEAAVTERTSAILAVNVFGAPPDVLGLAAVARRHGLRLLYDSAQGLGGEAAGRPVGSFGDVEVFSLSPTKVVTAFEGGLVTTADTDLADRIRRMRDYGKSASGEDVDLQGLAGRQSELHAAVALRGLERLDELVEHRRTRVCWYRELLSGVKELRFQEAPSQSRSAAAYLVVSIGPDAGASRDDVMRELALRGVETRRYFDPPLHRQTLFRKGGARVHGELPVTCEASAQGLALPLYPGLLRRDVERICAALREQLA